jgi:hypothetical protein
VKTTVRTRDNTDRGFHNVTIVGRTEDGEVVCRKVIGDMSVDDDLIGAYDIGLHRGLEAYSGDVNGKYIGKDETPEENQNGNVEWSIMKRGTAVDYSSTTNPVPRFAFSIEELITIDFNYIPSRSQS